MIEAFQRKRRVEGASNRIIKMDVGALRQVLRRFKQWRRRGRREGAEGDRLEEETRLFEATAGNPEWEHVYCAAVLAANTSIRGVEVKHVRRRHIDVEKPWNAESATDKAVVYVSQNKSESSKRVIPLNQAARQVVERPNRILGGRARTPLAACDDLAIDKLPADPILKEDRVEHWSS